MTSKKAIELSMNFIVVLIISIVIFGFGIFFISRLSSEAISIQDLTITELDERIGNLICEGSDRVCIGIEKKTIARGKLDVFGLKIMNVLDPPQGKSGHDFDIIINSPQPSPLGYTKNKEEITAGDSFKGLAIRARNSVFIKKNEEASIGIGVSVPKNAPSGTYIINIRIITENDNRDYASIQKIYVDVP